MDRQHAQQAPIIQTSTQI